MGANGYKKIREIREIRGKGFCSTALEEPMQDLINRLTAAQETIAQLLERL
jgi:hypothetical protein